MVNKNLEKQFAIVKRAESMGIVLGNDRLSALMDLEVANDTFALRLDDFLNADGFNFAHDFTGIQRYIDRNTKTFNNCFYPRYASK
jgi:hypothetical protein